MHNSLIIPSEASSSLNFLIYIQNLYLNQKRRNKELKYPLPSTRIVFNDDFEFVFKRLWDEIAERINMSQPQSNDMKIFYDEKALFYYKLFINDVENSTKYELVYESFRVWWESLAGQISIERYKKYIIQ